MDLYVERQCIDKMKEGDAKQFLSLYDANFNDVYKYVARRVSERNEVERIVRLTFLDALGLIQNTPVDSSYLIWLYSLAKPRVWDYIANTSMPEKQGLISVSESDEGEGEDIVEEANKMIAKLSLEEREILRLKFFEEVTDGDVAAILSSEEKAIGPKIYRVLKRAHFLLFGESDKQQGVYFGELSGFFERLRDVEEMEVPEVFRLSLKTDLSGRIDRKDYAIDAEVVKEEVEEEKKPFEVKDEGAAVGSDDPAKIFVEAVAEMKAEEAHEKIKAERKQERKEKMVDFMDRWRAVFGLVPVVLFVFIVAYMFKVVMNYSGKIERGFPTTCEVEIVYEGDLYAEEIRSVNRDASDRLCDYFEVEKLIVKRTGEGVVNVEVDVPEWFLEYRFVRKADDWRIKKYERTPDSDKKSRQV